MPSQLEIAKKVVRQMLEIEKLADKRDYAKLAQATDDYQTSLEEILPPEIHLHGPQAVWHLQVPEMQGPLAYAHLMIGGEGEIEALPEKQTGLSREDINQYQQFWAEVLREAGHEGPLAVVLGQFCGVFFPENRPV